MKNSVFISYARKDIELVAPFVEKINKEIGDVCWFDKNAVESGDLFENKIKTAIQKAKVVLFFYSRESLVSEWTYREMMYAHELGDGKRIVPIMLDSREIGGWFKVVFGNKDFKLHDSDEHIEALYNDLRRWLGRKVTRSWKQEEDGFTILFPDGSVVKNNKVLEALKECVIKIGVKDVFELNLKHNKEDLIFKRKPYGLDNLDEIPYRKSTYYIQRLQGKNVLEKLMEISDRLNKGLTIYSKYADEEEPAKDYVAEIELNYCEILSNEEIGKILKKARDFYDGTEKRNPNLPKAYEYYCRAAGAGNSDAWNELGILYQDSEQYPTEAAFVFYNKSHQLGNPYGSINLALCYIRGIGVDKDVTKGMVLIDEVCEGGLMPDDALGNTCLLAAYHLDTDRALPLLQRAIEYGNERAQIEMEIRQKYHDCLFVLCTEDVIDGSDRGTIVVGTVSKGSVAVGDEVVLTHNGKEHSVVVTAIHLNTQLVSDALPGERVGLLLRGVKVNEITQGDILIME